MRVRHFELYLGLCGPECLNDLLVKKLCLPSGIAVEDLFKGTVDQSSVYPREVIKRALDLNASGLIFVHNHPSGNLRPSESDKSLTNKLVSACKTVDLTPIDHLIISPSGYTSFKDLGLI